MKNTLTLVLLALASIYTYSVSADNQENMMSEKSTINVENNIVDNALLSEDHTTLVTAVMAANLVDVLQSEGPFTVFAPTNSAFSKLPEATLESLLLSENIDMLSSILTYHVVAGKYMASDIYDGLELTTVQGQKIMFTINGSKVYINGESMISAVDLQSSNGVIHVIDTVIVPKESYSERVKKSLELRSMIDDRYEQRVDAVVMKFQDRVSHYSNYRQVKLQKKFIGLIDQAISESGSNMNYSNLLKLLKLEIMNENYLGVEYGSDSFVPAEDVVDNLIDSENHSTLVQAVVAANLVDALKGSGPFTVFAPTNSAFAKLPEGTVEMLLEEESKETLTSILTYHVVAGAYLSTDVYDGLELTTLQGKELQFSIMDGKVYINGDAMIEAVDLVGSNGVIHVIDNVLTPED